MASNGDRFIYFLAGGFVGAAVALLFAPKSGEETRRILENKYKEGAERLTQKAREGKELLTERSHEMADRLGESIDKGRETVQRQKEQITAAVEAGKEAYEEEKRNLEGVGSAKAKKK